MSNEDLTGETATVKNVSALNARVLILESLNKKLIAERDEAVFQLKEANDLIEADTKARLVEQALGLTNMNLNELAGKDIGELETIITVTNLAKKPRFESGADVSAKVGKDQKIDTATYLHSLYVGNRRK